VRRFAPAAARNREALLEVLARVLPDTGTVLEIASGSGEHAVHFARALPWLEFQPSDPDADSRASIDAWRVHEGLPNLRAALAIDVTAPDWPVTGPIAAMLCSNMIHIAPWEAAVGLLRRAGERLEPGSPLVLYGPFSRGGQHTAQSNQRFDASLRERDPRWGVRDLDDVTAEAQRRGLVLDEVVPMPANNFSVVLRRVV